MIILKVNKEVCIGACARFSVPGYAEVRGNEIAYRLARDGFFSTVLCTRTFLGGL